MNHNFWSQFQQERVRNGKKKVRPRPVSHSLVLVSEPHTPSLPSDKRLDHSANWSSLPLSLITHINASMPSGQGIY